MEEILTQVSNRFVLFPIKYQSIWNMYKKAVSAFWTAEEIDMSKDVNDWEKLSENERHFIKHILAFFAGSDGIVNENLSVRFMNDVAPLEAKSFYGFQIAMENIHCVAAETFVLTDEGYKYIYQLEDKHANVWNGKRFSDVLVKKTSDNAKVIRVRLNNGMELLATRGHKWLIEGYDERVITQNLTVGMKLTPFKYPENFITQNERFFNNVYDHAVECLSEKDEAYNMVKYNFTPKYMVPINHTNDIKTLWLSGFFKDCQHTDTHIEVYHHSLEFIMYVQLLLTTLNIFSVVENVDYYDDNNNKIVKIVLDKKSYMKSLNVNGDYNNNYYNINENLFIKDIIDSDYYCKTYCFNEPYEHTGVFNGILTGQSETYSLLIDSYIKDPSEKERLLNAIDTIPCIKKKADWAVKWIENKDAPFSQRLVAFACVEGIFFSGAFCAIFWMKERGVLPGLCSSNEFISRDEGLHTEFAVLLYSMIENKLSQEMIYEIIKDAVEIEDEFINDSISCSMLGMNRELMSTYIKFVADRLIIQLGYEPIWNVTNPFDFMDRIGLDGKDNFFDHTRNSNYARANVGNESKDNFTFSTHEEF